MRGLVLRGFSMLEASLALSLLTLIFVFFVGTMQSSLGLRGRLELQSQALHVAQNKLAEVRAWANLKTGSQFNYAQLDQFQPGLQGDSALPFLQTQVSVANYTLASPNRAFELAHPNPRWMPHSVKAVTVRVLRGGQELTRLSSLIHEPFRGWSVSTPIRVQPASTRLPKDGTQTFSFTAYDAADQPLADLFCTWNVVPIDGVAMIDSQARDGSTAVLKNHARRRNGSYFYTGGSCRVAARIIYHGQERVGLSDPIALDGP